MRGLFYLLLLFAISVTGQQNDNAPPASANTTSTGQARPNGTEKQSLQQQLQAAHEALAHGKTEDALAVLEKLAATEGKNAEVQRELGVAYYRTGKLAAAEQAFARAMASDPSQIEAIQMRGLTLYRLGRYPEAIPFLEKVRQWFPDSNADANYVLGLCYVNSNRLDDARSAFAKQFGVDVNSASAHVLLAKVLMQSNLPEQAALSAKKATELEPNLPQAHLMVGEYLLFKSDLEGALKEFERERAINPANPAVYDRLGDVYTRSGQYQQAQESLAKAISLDTSITGPFIQMGRVLLRRNDPQTSLLYLQHAEKMDPGNYVTHTLLGQAYRSLGRIEDAKREIDTAAKIHSERQQNPNSTE